MLNRQERKDLLNKYKKQIEIIDEFIQTTDFSVYQLNEKIEITDDIFFFKSEYTAKEKPSYDLEDHSLKIDVHYAFRGNEAVVLGLKSELELTTEYNEDTDFTWYRPKDESMVNTHIINEGDYLVVFPGECHEPEVKVDSLTNQKIVFKITY